MTPPQFGTVNISIKPKNGTFVSDFNKSRILSQLKQYTVSGINQRITDLKILTLKLILRSTMTFLGYQQLKL